MQGDSFPGPDGTAHQTPMYTSTTRQRRDLLRVENRGNAPPHAARNPAFMAFIWAREPQLYLLQTQTQDLNLSTRTVHPPPETRHAEQALGTGVWPSVCPRPQQCLHSGERCPVCLYPNTCLVIYTHWSSSQKIRRAWGNEKINCVPGVWAAFSVLHHYLTF